MKFQSKFYVELVRVPIRESEINDGFYKFENICVISKVSVSNDSPSRGNRPFQKYYFIFHEKKNFTINISKRNLHVVYKEVFASLTDKFVSDALTNTETQSSAKNLLEKLTLKSEILYLWTTKLTCRTLLGPNLIR